MKSITGQLESLFVTALARAFGEAGRDVDPLIRPAIEERFGDYQSNVAMGLAKRLKRKPREVAQQVVDALAADADAVEMCEPFQIEGPGFINIRLKTTWLADGLNAIPAAAADDRLGMQPVAEPQTVVVDYSGPNIAKQMHVGHLRSTIIGDTIARVLEFEGHKVIRQNHLGDWGTQMGIILVAFDQLRSEGRTIGQETETLDGESTARPLVDLSAVEARYKQLNARIDSDEALRGQVREKLQRLQQAHPDSDEWRDWQDLRTRTIWLLNKIYHRLEVELEEDPAESDDTNRVIGTIEQTREGQPKYCGESWYRNHLQRVVNELRGMQPSPRLQVQKNEGALCVFLTNEDGTPAFKGPKGDPVPLIVQKSDETFLYATTDLAALRYRVDYLGADRIIYVTDARQIQHFEMVFATARGAGWTRSADGGGEVKLEHVTFGSILGPNRKPLKTRSGENIKLAELLDEAVSRAEALLRANEADEAKRRGFSEAEIEDVAEAVGIGAVKYADLSQNRQSDYVFSWDKMLAMEGNTAPYMMYAYARIRSIYRKGAERETDLAGGWVDLGESAERVLARQILRFAETIDAVAGGLRINLLTDYLYELAGAFMKFYETCPVLSADTLDQRASRLKLCDLTARTLKIGLNLLGIRVVERM